MAQFFCALSLNKTSPVEWEFAHQTTAASPRYAAVNALAASPEAGTIRKAFRDGQAVMAWVWDKSSPRHPNGAPMCIHGLELVRGRAGVESASA